MQDIPPTDQRRKASDQDKSEMVRLRFEEKWTIRALAARFHLSTTHVRRVLRQWGAK